MIDLTNSQEQDELMEWARGILTSELPDGRLLTSDLHTFPIEDLVKTLGALGWFELSAPESLGGGGLGIPDEALVWRELGRAIAPGPLLSTTIAAHVAANNGQGELAAALGRGDKVAGLAEVRPDGSVKILDAGPVEYLLVADLNSPSFALLDLANSDPIEFEPSIDPYHDVAFVETRTLPTPVLEERDSARELLAYARVLSAAFLTGLAEGARDRSAAYAKERIQFGKPIGTFQAVKHRCADTAVRSEAAWAQTAVAAIRLADAGAEEAELEVAAAKIVASDAAIRNSRDNIQNHGGIGYTFENDAHLYLKRSHIIASTFGDPRSFTTLLLEGTTAW
jgi:alkylation response protein AidB-like acyl-CoA dehydrogenase